MSGTNQTETLNAEQKKIIENASSYGAEEEQLKILESSGFSVSQMEELFEGIRDGLNERQLKIMANPVFLPAQMAEIRKGFTDGLTEEEILHIAKPGITAKQMSVLRRQSARKLMKEAPELFRKEDIEKLILTSRQQSEYLAKSMDEIHGMHKFMREHAGAGDEDHLRKELDEKNNRIERLEAEAEDMKEEMEALREENAALEASRNSMSQDMQKWKQAAMQKKPDDGIVSFDEILHECLHRRRREKKGKIPEIVRFMASGGFDESQLEQIRLGYENGLSMKEIRAYTKPGTEAGKMECMRKILINMKKGENT